MPHDFIAAMRDAEEKLTGASQYFRLVASSPVMARALVDVRAALELILAGTAEPETRKAAEEALARVVAALEAVGDVDSLIAAPPGVGATRGPDGAIVTRWTPPGVVAPDGATGAPQARTEDLPLRAFRVSIRYVDTKGVECRDDSVIPARTEADAIRQVEQRLFRSPYFRTFVGPAHAESAGT